MSDEDPVTVLVVDDEEMVADMFSLQLGQVYDVRTAYGGEAALETIDDDVDVVLLDRRMPGLSGDEVLSAIRERGYDCRVIMVTAVDAGLDILEMPCDAYLEKPVSGDGLKAAVQKQLDIRTYDSNISELYALSSKLAALEAEMPSGVLEDSEEYQAVRARRDELKREADALADDIDPFELF